jgi:hypothetical protein
VIVRWLGLCALAAPLVLAAPASALTLGFYCITGSIAGDCDIGEAQLTVDVTDEGGGQVRFTFDNTGPDDSSIADVYFDDGALLDIASIVNGPGVSFSEVATPGNLPGANNVSPPFQTTQGPGGQFSADSNPPVQPNGVNPGETLAIIFDLQLGKTFADVLADLASGALRIGIHVQGYESGGSESFVNNPVPEAGAVLLLAGGLALAARRRRTRRS